jgi:hypothetical protein
VSQFEYVAVLISIIVGLALTQILRGVGRMVTGTDGPRPYWVHLLWTFYLFQNITLFWWWEFRLGMLEWSLAIYLVVIIYATLFFFASLVMQPGTLDGIDSYKDYFYSRRRWIFSLMIAITAWDFIDSSMKGATHFLSLGIEYLTFNIFYIIGCTVAIITTNERYHKIFVVAWLAVFFVLQFETFFVID